MGRARRLTGSLVVAGAVCAASGAAAPAEVSTDGTLGRRVRLTGPDLEVGADLGRVRGRNLFHSFERFGVGPGGRVTFTGPSGLDNVVSRVTGGEASRIDGTLASKVPGADVWLVNPAGVVFGPGARLDVPGSFHASTADEVRFGDGAAFSARDPSGSSLSVARPEAFGFLGGGRPGAISVDRGTLVVPAGEGLSLVGGDVEVIGAGGPEPGPGALRAEAGRITVAALGGPGAVSVATGEAAGPLAGDVRLAGRALVDASGDGGGVVAIRGGRLVVEGSLVFADNGGDADASGGVAIEARTVSIGGGSFVTADAFAGGDAGTVRVAAGDAELRDGAVVGSAAFGAGDAGRVAVVARRLSVVGGPGSDAPTTITSQAREGTGDAGTVTVAADAVELRGGGSISSITSSAGDAGTVTVDTGRLLAVGDAGSTSLTGVTSDAQEGSSGEAGTVTVEAGDGRVELRDTAQISSVTAGRGSAGTVSVRAGRLLIVGDPGAGFTTGVRSEAVAGSAGRAGAVTVSADALEVRRSGLISSAASGAGDGGAVEVAAGRLLIVGDPASRFVTGITTQANAGSAAGRVAVAGDEITLRDGGEVTSSAAGGGPAGDVVLRAGTLLVEDAAVRTVGTGAAGGRIDVAARRLIRLADADVTSNGIVPAEGASLIVLEAPLVVLGASRVTSLTGDGRPLEGSGEARLLGGTTVISADSVVAATSSVETTGLENELGSGLQLSPGSFLSADAMFDEGCGAGRAGRASTFTRAARGGLPPAPDLPLASPGGDPGGPGVLPPPRRSEDRCGHDP